MNTPVSAAVFTVSIVHVPSSGWDPKSSEEKEIHHKVAIMAIIGSRCLDEKFKVKV